MSGIGKGGLMNRADAGTTTANPRVHQFAAVTAALFGVVFLGSGLWAMVGPESFFDAVAEFPPYNQHLVQDIGAFQIGLGAVLLFAVAARGADGMTVGLLGVGTGSAAHVVSHLVGQDLGGEPSVDIPLFTVATLMLLAGGVVSWRHHRTAP